MQETLTSPLSLEQVLENLSLQSIDDAKLLTHLRQTHQLAQITHQIQQDHLVRQLCQQFDIQISDQDLQSAGDTFRREHQLLGAPETLAWLADQQITAEDWTEGIRQQLLRRQLANYLFGQMIDSSYMSDRDAFRRVALSQIVVRDLATAQQLAQQLQQQPASLSALALDYSQSRPSKDQGGFMGIHYLRDFAPEIVQAIADQSAGKIVGPVKSKQSYHLLRVEKWFAPHLDEDIRQTLLEKMLQNWLETTVRSLLQTSKLENGQ
ncbi:MAG: peptidylprolyl isomerase [Cyanobacteria bacterium P01_G01_bin.38]